MNTLVLTAQQGPVSTITLNRGQRHNSLTPAFLSAILQALDEVPTGCRVLLLRANGRSFSTGGDVQGFFDQRENLPRYAEEIVGLLNKVILAMLDLPQPIITAVQGLVTGGSLGLVLASDIVFVAADASFTPYYNVVGFSPDGGWASWLPKIIGARRTAESLLCNRTITAKEAVEWGLATRLVEPGLINDAAEETAECIARMKGGSIRHSKRLLTADRTAIAAGLAREKALFVTQIDTTEARQGIVDFLANSRLKR